MVYTPAQAKALTSFRIPSSVLKHRVLTYLYRTVTYGFEKRYRVKMTRAAAAASATSSAAASRPTSPTPVSDPGASVVENSDDEVVADTPSTARAASDVKYRRGSGIRVADSLNQSSSRFGRFPSLREMTTPPPARMTILTTFQQHAPRHSIEGLLDLEQQQPASVTALSPNDAQIPARPIRSSLPSLSPEPMSVSRSACQRHAVLPTSYMIAQGVRRRWIGLLQWKKRIREGLEQAEDIGMLRWILEDFGCGFG
ncbi:hypothetical protein CVT25_008854 [Psilocybe cyanescens]|uniref:Uncharacterized protein n=1 Tax=Psilocybe cyanescens TaxID=93625 RepID=A0A409XAQ7_PSICY|nr:hypothetical protein CVT25_008854 [Psilocybe cyanescens]